MCELPPSRWLRATGHQPACDVAQFSLTSGNLTRGMTYERRSDNNCQQLVSIFASAHEKQQMPLVGLRSPFLVAPSGGWLAKTKDTTLNHERGQSLCALRPPRGSFRITGRTVLPDWCAHEAIVLPLPRSSSFVGNVAPFEARCSFRRLRACNKRGYRANLFRFT